MATLQRHDSGIEVVDTHQSSFASAGTNPPKMRKTAIKRKWMKAVCPPRGWPVKYLTWGLVLTTFLGALWSVYPGLMHPHMNLFSLSITIPLCIAAEQLVVKIPTPKGYPPLPPLLASLLMGLLLRNLPAPGNIAAFIEPESSAILRKLSLTVILTRAGLEIDPQAMKKIKWAVIRLAFSPCLVETITIGILAHFLLNFPFIWSFMLGFVIAAVSPAVVIPSLIILQDLGYGVAKGIPSLVMAASGIDDVLAITGFTVLLGIAIPTGAAHDFISVLQALIYPSPSPEVTTLPPTTASFTQIPTNNSTFPPTLTAATALINSTMTNLSMMSQDVVGNAEDASEIGKEIGGAVIEVAIGVISGLVLGLFISYVPFRGMRYKSFCRGFLLLGIGIFMVFGTTLWNIGGAGTLCALIMSFTASLRWKNEAEPLARAWHFLWIIFQPILFGLTGTLVDVRQMDGFTVGLGLAVLGIALVTRLMTSTAVTFGLNLNIKERIFVSVSWIPKGTVQAALCSTALDQARAQHRSPIEIYHATQILVLAVLITLITAPLGAFAISTAGPRLLVQSPIGGPSSEDGESGQSEESHSKKKRNSIENSIADSGLEFRIREHSHSDDGNENFGFEDETQSTVM